jgi:Predicted unusual protein kinase
MKIFRLIHIFLRLRKSGIFYLFTENFNPLVKPLQKPKNIEKNFKETLESLGPFFIKLGQLISTRTDLISLELAKELRNLTDNCAPVDFNYIKDQINEGLGSRAKTILENITEKPSSFCFTCAST